MSHLDEWEHRRGPVRRKPKWQADRDKQRPKRGQVQAQFDLYGSVPKAAIPAGKPFDDEIPF